MINTQSYLNKIEGLEKKIEKLTEDLSTASTSQHTAGNEEMGDFWGKAADVLDEVQVRVKGIREDYAARTEYTGVK